MTHGMLHAQQRFTQAAGEREQAITTVITENRMLGMDAERISMNLTDEEEQEKPPQEYQE